MFCFYIELLAILNVFSKRSKYYLASEADYNQNWIHACVDYEHIYTVRQWELFISVENCNFSQSDDYVYMHLRQIKDHDHFQVLSFWAVILMYNWLAKVLSFNLCFLFILWGLFGYQYLRFYSSSVILLDSNDFQHR